jgi:SAM-dependent methyltransferase
MRIVGLSSKRRYAILSNKNTSSGEQRLQELRQYWDGLASTFDDEPDHGLREPLVLEAWQDALKRWLPTAKAMILDIGCGTGSLSVIFAGLGHTVTGIDLSPTMVSLAEAKAKSYGYQIKFQVMDAAFPELPHRHYDVIVCRHLLWTLPEPKTVLSRWLELLRQDGRLILIEGYWGTDVGIHAEEIVGYLPPSLTNVSTQDLSEVTNLWGRVVTDERYAVIADLHR